MLTDRGRSFCLNISAIRRLFISSHTAESEEEVEEEEEDPLVGHMRRSVGVAVKEVRFQHPRAVM